MSTRSLSHHGRYVVQALQVLHDPTLVSWFHPGEATGRLAGLTLQVGGELVKLPPR